MNLVPGSRIGAYQIVGSLGAGGMGEVYRAHDPRLGRDVALKVLPADMASDPARLERFTREARAIAALNHPHIVTIYSTEEADGIRFLTMELVEGPALDALIPSGGMSLKQFLELAMPLADALNAAHQKQITHRDLKPANVMVSSDGRVKVLDFGLARVGGPHPINQTIDATRQLLTGEGTIVGTMPYMSPEQVEGKQLDQRTDLFSLGVMFHEMLAGARPFIGESSPQLISSILRDTPSSTSDLRSDIPYALSRLISRCLEKNPDDRVQTARDVYNELRHVQKQLESGPARRSDTGSPRTGVADSLWIAVLPFTTRSTDSDAAAVASGLTEDITGGLALFPSLSVVALQSARSFKDSPLDARQIAERLNARYLMSGNVRKSGAGLRIGVHLIDAHNGTQLWSETYDRRLDNTDIFAVQDDVTDRVVATVADKAGVLARSMAQATENFPVDRLNASQLVHRGWAFEARPSPAEHAELRAAMEAMVDRPPHHAELWAELAIIYVAEHCLLYNPLPDSLGRGLRTAKRAIEIDRTNQRGWVALAEACFFSRDEAGFHEAGNRVLALNPRNSNAVAWIGTFTTHKGEYDSGCALMERAIALNPVHPGWYHFPLFNRHFAHGDYQEALRAARRVNVPGFMWMHLAIASACGQLGLVAEGQAAVRAMETLAPPLADEATLREFLSRWFWDEPVVEGMVEGVRRSKGAAAVPSAPARPGSSPAAVSSRRPPSSAVTAASTWVAVMPFLSAGTDEDTQALADGLTEDITAGLARFPWLSVVAEHSARQQKGTTADVRQIGKALGARYILDGRIRRGGGALRITARLVDAESGAQLWSETYTRETPQGDPLAIQDDVTDRVVATVADVHGVLMRSATVGVRAVPIAELTPEELRLRYWSYHRQHAPSEHGLLRDHFERLVEANPAFAPFWAVLAHLYLHEYAFAFNVRPEPLQRARQAVDRALELDALNQHAWETHAFAQFFEHDRERFTHAVDRVLTLNPRNANAMALMGILLVHTGEFERGVALADRAMAINPDHPGWYHMARANHEYALGNDEAALGAAKRVNMPQHVWAHLQVAIGAGQLGRAAEATAALDALFAIAPAIADERTLREMGDRWKWRTQDVDRMMDGFRKAMALRAASQTSRLSTDTATPPAPPERATTAIDAAAAAPQAQAKGLRIAVLPFTWRGGDDAASLADGLTDDVTTGLSRFGYLRVLSRAAASGLSGSGGTDTRAAGARLGARYVLEGNVRTAGTAVRVTVRLIDTETDANLWADNIDRDAGTGGFTLQDEVASRIVATVGDSSGALAHAMALTLADEPLDRLTVSELVILFNVYIQHLRREEHARLREAFERALEREPRAAEGWGCLAMLYSHEHSLGMNPLPDPLERHRRAAERAAEIDPGCQTAWLSLSSLHLFARDASALRAAVERGAALNPLNADFLANCAIYLSAAGDRERAVALIGRASELKPQHPGWYHFPRYAAHYHLGEYEEALREAKLINMPAVPQANFAAAICAGQLGREPEARLALEALRRINPELITPAGARRVWNLWNWDERFVDHQIEGLEKALALTQKARPSDTAEAKRAEREASDIRRDAIDMSVTVRPFAVRAGDGESADLAEGLLEHLVTGLSRFPFLRVRSGSAATPDAVRSGAGKPDSSGSRFVVDGGVKRSGRTLRINVRLLEVASSTTLWAEQYDCDASADTFTIQDDVGDRVIATLADEGGALYRVFADGVRTSTSEGLAALRLFVRFADFIEHFTVEEHGRLRDEFEALVQSQPGNATAWAQLSILYGHEVFFSFNPLPDPIARMRRAAERAVATDSTNQTGWFAIANVAFSERNAGAFRSAAEHVVELNPLRSRTLGAIGLLRAFAGDTDGGAALVARAVRLNPRHPGWFHIALFLDAFQRGDADRALGEAARINMPHLPVDGRLFAAAAAGRFGRTAEAAAALNELRREDSKLLDPRRAREVWAIRIWDGELLDSLVDGLEKALRERSRDARADAPTQLTATDSVPAKSPDSSTGISADAFVVTVLPFASSAPGGDASDLADGLTQGIAVGLSRFSYLRVVTRNVLAESITAGYVLHGSVRIAGGVVRLVTQLTDASTGQSLWADTYDRKAGGSLFDLQDELTEKIVATVASADGALVRALALVVRQKQTGVQTPYEAVIRALAYGNVLSPEEHAQIRDALEQAVERAPSYADAWAALAFIYCEEFSQGFNLRPEPLQRARMAARRAVQIDASSQLAYVSLARIAFFSKDRSGFNAAAERATSLNPLDPYALGFIGTATAYSGDWDEGLALLDRAMALNPHHSRILRLASAMDHYRRRDYAGALDVLERANIPSYPPVLITRAVILAQLGRVEEAAEAWQEAISHVPGYVNTLHEQLPKWFTPDFVAHFEEGLAKARAASAPPKPRSSTTSVAVLPFADLSAEKDQDWFCDGIAEEILNALTQLRELRVAARTSAFSFRDRAGDLRAIAEKLGVTQVLQGSVRRAGDRVRISVQLVDARTGFQHWSNQYDREIKDIFDVQDEIARSVAGRLKIALGTGPETRLVSAQTPNIAAYELYLKGRALLYRRGASVMPALDHFRRAVELDPDYAPAWAGIADAYVVCGFYGLLLGHEVRQQGLAAARRALALDPQSADAHTSLAALRQICENDIEGAGAAFGRALELNPAHVQARCWHAIFYLHAGLGQFEQGVAEARRAQAVDPLSAYTATILAMALVTADRAAEGVEEARRAVALDPQSFVARYILGMALLYAGALDEAVPVLEEAAAISGRHHFALVTLARTCQRQGDSPRAQALHAELLQRAASSFVPSAQLAVSADAAGNREEALAHARRALDDREPPFILLARHWPDFAVLRQDPRFVALIRELDRPAGGTIDR